MATVTAERIAAVHHRIVEAINQTSERSTLSKEEQSALLGQRCAEACDLLEDWLKNPWWDEMRPSRSVAGRARRSGSSASSLGEFVPSQKRFEEFLDQAMGDVLARAAYQCRITISVSDVDHARAALKATARRYPLMTRQDLFLVANSRIEALKSEVCKLAARLRGRIRMAGPRKKARTVLMKVVGLLTAFILAISGFSPSAVAHNLGQWDRNVVEVIHTITLYHIAERAEPNRPVEPPTAADVVYEDEVYEG
jgi:hypothetical protein